MPRVRLCVAYLVVEEGLRGGGLRRDEVGWWGVPSALESQKLQ